MSEKDYKCEYCGGIFGKGWSDEEAMEEANNTFSKEEQERDGMSIICDDCYTLFTKWFKG